MIIRINANSLYLRRGLLPECCEILKVKRNKLLSSRTSTPLRITFISFTGFTNKMHRKESARLYVSLAYLILQSSRVLEYSQPDAIARVCKQPKSNGLQA